ncbi:DUF1835 domain-containing protein [Rossellomorea sp. SC111]|uniref:DUF1835 domain-containing protein n=1 Tax=Rossellomorea sp. SC111 TaxID=2968985 RepID=UPI00215AFE94|nr:DUF1835 domain-containing protein [Rossellomorea sp. SC111]MCR8848026.1 DUF1835 domain-containing protein [Rossellomorea sp. SC111]
MIDELKKQLNDATEEEVKSLLFHMLYRLNMNEGPDSQKIHDVKKMSDNFQEYKKLQSKAKKETFEVTHILFGDSASGSLKMVVNEREQVLSFQDVFSTGPVWQLHEEEGIDRRFKWLENHILFEWDEWEEYRHRFNETMIAMNEIPSHIPIMIWAGENAHEQVALRYVLYQLRTKLNPIVLVNTTYEDRLHTGELSSEILRGFYDKEHEPLGREERKTYEKEWLELSSTREVLRIWEKGSIKSVPEDHFDKYIIRAAESLHNEQECHGFMKSARLIGEVIGHTENYIGDGFIEYRVRHLVMSGVFQLYGVPKGMRFYSVKLNERGADARPPS